MASNIFNGLNLNRAVHECEWNPENVGKNCKKILDTAPLLYIWSATTNIVVVRNFEDSDGTLVQKFYVKEVDKNISDLCRYFTYISNVAFSNEY